MSLEETVRVIDSRWKNTCKILLKRDIGPVNDYAEWLSRDINPINHRKSSLSGKTVVSAPTEYALDSRWLSFDEVDFNKKFEPLNINEIKDIDSITTALSERFYYAGNIFFGKFSHLDNSSNINDSHYIYEVGRCGNSKYLAYCTMGRLCEDCFGCDALGESSFCISCNRCFKNIRCFETWMSQHSSDCYYSFGLINCKNCIFSFNMTSRNNCIGNLELSNSKYENIKEKLISEFCDELEAKKSLPSIIHIINKCGSSVPSMGFPEVIYSPPPTYKSKIDVSFEKTSALIFGKKLDGGVDSYAKWLSRHTRPNSECQSAATKRKLFLPPYARYPDLPKNRLLSLEEAERFGSSINMTKEEVDSLSLKNAHELINRLAFFNVEMFDGANSNMIDCAICADSSDCYKSSVTVYTKNSAYCFWPRSCQYIFGCDSPFDSSFSINCYSCTQLTRCFEIDCCGYCSDLYFGHNCENVHDSMFCFNVKNRRNSIGNASYSQNDYSRIKNLLVSQWFDELSSKKDLKFDIYNLGSLTAKE